MKMSKEDLEEKMFWDAADFARDDLEHAIGTMNQMIDMEKAHRAKFKGAIGGAEDPMVRLGDDVLDALSSSADYVDSLAAINGRPVGDYWPESDDPSEDHGHAG